MNHHALRRSFLGQIGLGGVGLGLSYSPWALAEPFGAMPARLGQHRPTLRPFG
jgi:hypothetical protein